MTLCELKLDLKQPSIPEPVSNWITVARQRIELYWDQFPTKPLPQYIECDFDLVALALCECARRQLSDGQIFCEWGCGFGIVTGIASLLEFDAIGIEAEEFLCQQARELLRRNGISADVWQGNFLPSGARELAYDEDPLVSLTHSIEPAYARYDMSISDFAIVYVYPWPGEEHFLKTVFDHYARPGALLLLYRGPYHIELYRKKSNR